MITFYGRKIKRDLQYFNSILAIQCNLVTYLNAITKKMSKFDDASASYIGYKKLKKSQI